MSSSSFDAAHRPMEESLLHKLLVGAQSLQRLPTPLVAILLVGSAVIAGWMWRDRSAETAVIMGMGVLFYALFNWGMLTLLPMLGRSFGPDKPSALALSALGVGATMLLGWLGTSPLLVMAVWVALTATAFYATWVEPFDVRLTRETLQVSGWAPPLNETKYGVRVLHVADLHIERISPRERTVNAMIATLAPDMIVFTGDFVNLSNTNDPIAEVHIRQVIGAWRAPLGVYCVPGTPIVEPIERVRAFVAGLPGVTLLENQWVTVIVPSGDALHILGMVTTHDLDIDRAALAHLLTVRPEGGATLLLTHSPDVMPEAAAAGIDMYVCGHTHGGQIRLPVIGALFSSSQLGQKFIKGRYTVGAMTGYTSRGVGMEGLGAPRARLLCPPEIILWEIEGG